MTCTDTSSPTRRAAAAPASVAALTAPTSPRHMTVTYAAPMYSLPISVTLAVLTMASAASTDPMRPLVSMRPRASWDIRPPRETLTYGAPPTIAPPHEIRYDPLSPEPDRLRP